MSKNQYIFLFGTLAIVVGLYFGFDTVPSKLKQIEQTRAINMESTGVNNLLKSAFDSLAKDQKSMIEAINLELDGTGTDTIKRIEKLKALSGTWYEYGFPSLAGVYAEELATYSKTEEPWSITGTTFALCVKNATDEKVRDFCSKRSIKAFENAISINPESVQHRINLAICFVDNPSPDNPMQGILMLRELNEKHPENVSVMNQLAQLALQTNQNDKALARLEVAIKLEPENKNTICLIAEALKRAGKTNEADAYYKKCIN